MIGFVFLLASGMSDSDMNAAVMYVQSYSTPALFDVCKTVVPEKAGEFDMSLAAWQEKNAAIVARGEEVIRAKAKEDGTDFEAKFSAERDSMVSDLQSMGKTEQRESCEHFLEVARSEL